MSEIKAGPRIISFETNAGSVSNNQPFILSWEVRNANEIELYKNDIVQEKFEPDVTSVTLKEYYDGQDRDIVFSLVASNNLGQTKSSPLLIKLVEKAHRSDKLPVITSFKSSALLIYKNEPVTLSWTAKNATDFELYRNEMLLKRLDANNTDIDINEFFDGQVKTVEFSLVAINDHGESKRESLRITVGDIESDVRSSDIVEPDIAESDVTESDVTKSDLTKSPEIISFKTSALSVNKGEKFTLQWQANNATYFQVFRNGSLLKKLSGDETSLGTIVFENPEGQRPAYVLLAGNNNAEVKSEPILIEIKSNAVKPLGWINPTALRLYLFGALFLIIVIIIGFIFYNSSHGKPEITDFSPDTIVEEHTLVLTGNNLPTDTNKFQIIFNKVKGKIEYSAKNLIRVVVPNLADNYGDGKVDIALVLSKDTIYSSKKLTVTRKTAQESITPSQVVVKDSLSQPNIASVPVVTVPKTRVKTNSDNGNRNPDSLPHNNIKHDPGKDSVAPKKINLNELVTVSGSDFKKGLLGGVKNLKLTVQNHSPYDLDNVTVVIGYDKRNEKEIKQAEIEFTSIKAHDSSTQAVPNTKRGSKVTFSIKTINSKQYDAAPKR